MSPIEAWTWDLWGCPVMSDIRALQMNLLSSVGSVRHILCVLDQIQICGIWKSCGLLELYVSFHRPFLSSFCCVWHIVLLGRLGLCH